jgi:hypothetical protein
VRVAWIVLVAVACQRGSDAPRVDAAYVRDIERVCDARRLADVESQPGANPQLVVAQWLGANLETEEARGLLARLAGMQGAAKIAALDGEAKRVGRGECALAREWAARGTPVP